MVTMTKVTKLHIDSCNLYQLVTFHKYGYKHLPSIAMIRYSDLSISQIIAQMKIIMVTKSGMGLMCPTPGF